jgi:transposase
METKYSNTFKIEAVKKALSRAKESSMNSVARSLGIANSTLHGWVKAVGNRDLNESPTSGGFNEKKSFQLTSQEKLEAIVYTANLTQEQISEYCRKKGIFPHHLKAWKQEFIEGAMTKNS